MYRPFEEFHPAGRFISVIGSGGKTTFLRFWADRLPGTVILTTSTHILPFPGIPLVDASPANGPRVLPELRAALAENRVVCLGGPGPNGKLSSPESVLPFASLLSEADYVLVEADGARRLPLKAHRPWEPVIPACSDVTVCLIGASGIGKPVAEVCHRPDRFASLAGIPEDAPASPEAIAAVLNQEALADLYLVNQADMSGPADVRCLCDLIRWEAFPVSLAAP